MDEIAPSYSEVVTACMAVFPAGQYPPETLSYVDDSKEMEKVMEAD